MARPKNAIATHEPPPDIPEKVAERITAQQNEAVAQYDKALVLAKELGYQGAVTVDALEVEIRFYQRRSVEALLEVGKLLLVLKELSAHGEFAQRVESLGFHMRTAQRFMQAATKTAKSDTVSHLAKEMKSSKAFLELVTHDDDADLEKLAELDEIDRLSASQVREKLRELQSEREATQKLLDAKNQKMDRLEAQLLEARTTIKPEPPPDEQRIALSAALSGAAISVEQAITHGLREAISALLAHGREHGHNEGRDGAISLAAGCVMQVQQALNDVRNEFELPSFQNYVPDWLASSAAEPLPKYDPAAPLAEGDVLLADLALDPDEIPDELKRGEG